MESEAGRAEMAAGPKRILDRAAQAWRRLGK